MAQVKEAGKHDMSELWIKAAKGEIPERNEEGHLTKKRRKKQRKYGQWHGNRATRRHRTQDDRKPLMGRVSHEERR